MTIFKVAAPKYSKPRNLVMVLLGAFLVTTIWFYLGSVFYNDKGKMVYPRYIPENKWTGNDFFLDYKFATNYFVNHKSAYIRDDPENWYLQNAYPPLFTFYLYPMFLFDISWIGGYRLVYGLILFFYLLMSLVLPYFYHRSRSIPPIIILLTTAGMTSYGLQFALERGQFDVIAMGICLTSVYMFWYFPKLRWLSYILFFLAFQFKIYPYVFILCFIENWRDWKRNLIRLGSLTGAIILSLFVMGTKGFFEFLRAISYQTKGGVYSRDHGVNYGIDYLLGTNNINVPSQSILVIKAIVVLIGIVVLAAVLVLYFKSMPSGSFYPPLLFACMIFAMAFFPASKDYKLPLLTAVFGVYSLYLEMRLSDVTGWRSNGIHIVYLLMAFCYCSTLYSYAYRPVLLQNSFPFLFVIMLCIPIIERALYVTKKPQQGPIIELLSV